MLTGWYSEYGYDLHTVTVSYSGRSADFDVTVILDGNLATTIPIIDEESTTKYVLTTWGEIIK